VQRLIDLPPGEFIEFEEEIQVIAACLYVLSVKYDKEYDKEAEKRPARASEEVRKVSANLAVCHSGRKGAICLVWWEMRVAGWGSGFSDEGERCEAYAVAVDNKTPHRRR